MHQGSRGNIDDALRLFTEAVRLDPAFAPANGMAAWCYAHRKLNGWVADREAETVEADRLARQATRLGKDDAVALATGGFALAIVGGEVEDAAAFAERALALNPNLATAWLLSGMVKLVGEPEAAIERLLHAMRLSPLDPFSFRSSSMVGMCHFLAGRYDEAVTWAEKALRDQTDWAPAARIVAASHAAAGRDAQARTAMERALRIDPAMRISRLRELVPLVRQPKHRAKLEAALRKAGLPE